MPFSIPQDFEGGIQRKDNIKSDGVGVANNEQPQTTDSKLSYHTKGEISTTGDTHLLIGKSRKAWKWSRAEVSF